MPTLFVGLGGTGTKIIGLIKRKMQDDTIGENLLSGGEVAFMAFDTVDTPVSPHIDGNTEFFKLGGFDATVYVDDQRLTSPDFKDWWPDPPEPKGSQYNPPGSITEGAGGIRAVGRLALHHDIGGHIPSIERVIGRLTVIDNAAGTTQIDVYVCAILSNGTGGGTFLDMGYILQERIRQAGAVPSATAVLLDAGIVAAFSNSPLSKHNAQVNGYAALRELETWMKSSRKFIMAYNGHILSDTSFNNTGSPFNYCFLIQAHNEDGKILENFDDYIDVAAEGLFQIAGSAVRRLIGARWVDGIAAIIGAGNNRGMSSSYASLGVSILSFPVEQVTDYCAFELGEELLSHLEQIPAGTHDSTKKNATNLLHMLKLQEKGQDQLFETLEEHWSHIRTMSNTFRSGLNDASENTWEQRINNVASEFNAAYERFKEDVEKQSFSIVEDAIENFDGHIRNFLNQGLYSTAKLWVGAVLAELRANKKDVDDNDLPLTQNKPGFLTGEKGYRALIADAYDSWLWFGKSTRIQESKEEYLSGYWSPMLNYRLLGVSVPAIIRIYEALIKHIEHWDNTFDYVSERLNSVLKKFQKYSSDKLDREDIVQNKYVFNIPVGASRGVLSELYMRERSNQRKFDNTAKAFCSRDLSPLLDTVRSNYARGAEGLRALNDDNTQTNHADSIYGSVYRVGRGVYDKPINGVTIEDALTREAKIELEPFWRIQNEGTAIDKLKVYARLSKLFGANAAMNIRTLEDGIPPGEEERVHQEEIRIALSARVLQLAALARPLWHYNRVNIRPVEYMMVGINDTQNPNLYNVLRAHPTLENFQSIDSPSKLVIWNGSGAVPLHFMRHHSVAAQEFSKSNPQGPPPLHTDRRYFSGGAWCKDIFPISAAKQAARHFFFALAGSGGFISPIKRAENDPVRLAKNLALSTKGRVLGLNLPAALTKIMSDDDLFGEIQDAAQQWLDQYEKEHDVLKTLERLKEQSENLKEAMVQYTGTGSATVYQNMIGATNGYIINYQNRNQQRLEHLRLQLTQPTQPTTDEDS